MISMKKISNAVRTEFWDAILVYKVGGSEEAIHLLLPAIRFQLLFALLAGLVVGFPFDPQVENFQHKI